MLAGVAGLRVRASAVQAERLLGWAQAWPERAWRWRAPSGSVICSPGNCSGGGRGHREPARLTAGDRLVSCARRGRARPWSPRQ